MKRNSRAKYLGGLIVLTTLFISLQGCATAPVPTDYFGKEIHLIQDPQDPSLFWWEKPGFNWHQYHKLIIDPIRLQIDDRALKKTHDPEALALLGDELKSKVIDTLAPEYAIVTTPGTDVLRVRATIIDIKTSNPAINLATTAAFFVPLDMGGAAIAVDFFDSMTGQRLAAMVDRKTGTPLQLIDGFSRLGHTRAAFDQWAQALKLALVNNP